MTKIIKSNKGCDLLVDIDNNIFSLNKKRERKYHWRCRNRKCMAKIQTDTNYKVIDRIDSHNHGLVSKDVVQSLEAVQKMKALAKTHKHPHEMSLVKLCQILMKEPEQRCQKCQPYQKVTRYCRTYNQTLIQSHA